MNKKLILGAFAIGIGLVLALSGAPLASNTITVQELTQNQDTYTGEKITVSGVIKENSIKATQDGTTFTLQDKEEQNHEIKIIYDKNIPTQDDEGKTTQIKGTLTQDGVLEAENVEIGCKNSYN